MALTITKPTIGGSSGTWGNTLNSALDAIVAYVNGLGSGGPYLPSTDYATPGTADVTTALQSWMDDAATQGRVALLMPGEWRANLTVPHGLVVQGITAGGYETEVADTYQSRLYAVDGSDTSALTVPAGNKHVHIRGLHIDGGTNTAGHGVEIADSVTWEEGQVHVEHCYITYSAEDGVYVGTGRRACKVKDTTMLGQTGNGVTVNASDATVMQCIVTVGGVGIVVNESLAKVAFNDIFDSYQGITVGTDLQGFSIVGNGIDRHQREGIRVSSGCVGTISANVLHQNSLASTGTYSHIELAAGCGAVSVGGNTFQDDGVAASAAYGIHVADGGSSPAKVYGNTGTASCYVSGLTNVTPSI